MQPPRSLRHEYELFVEREIEAYKDSVPRSALLALGDEAVATLREAAQTTLTEMVLWEEVDRIIARRLRLPAYRTWQRRRLKMLAELRRPERWGFAPHGALARELGSSARGEHVLVAGAPDEGTAIFSAALGGTVTAIAPWLDAVERVLTAAEHAGLATRVRGCVGDLSAWAPDVTLQVVVCAPAAFAGLEPGERDRAIATLQSATRDGGVHLVQTLVGREQAGRPTALRPDGRSPLPGAGAGTAEADLAEAMTGARPTLDELRARYAGWAISVEPDTAPGPTFLARKPTGHDLAAIH